MGTKRALAPTVREAVVGLKKRGPVADLFSGMGSVATSMASTAPVLTNDVLAFTTTFARARFLPGERVPGGEVARRLFPHFRVAYELLRDDFGHRISRERTAMSSGHSQLSGLMDAAPHVGNSDWYRRHARWAANANSVEQYRLAVLYFSASYFSTTQAAQLDALRYAIDQLDDEQAVNRDWLMAAWLAAAGVVINAPGHAAQFLKPRNEAVYKRIRRQWQRPIWSIFVEQLDAIQAVGTKKWRARNSVCNEDALTLVELPEFDGVAVVYADPPYTKDHYSRFYHVYETLYLYDFPASHGVGRYRPDRFQTPFSLARNVEDAFRKLFRGVAKQGLPLVLSYPDNGLLHRGGTRVTALLEEHFSIRAAYHVTLQHSTLGASSGSQTKAALEGVYVCVP
jgi:adenine-specific DNA-methyltransferase